MEDKSLIQPVRTKLDETGEQSAPRIRPGEVVSEVPAGHTIIKAAGLELKNLLGTPYSGVNMEVKAGQVFAICGQIGSGKTSLLLTCAGRMLFTKGTLEIMGRRMPRGLRYVNKRARMAHFEGLNDINGNERVANAFSAEFQLYSRKPKKQDVLDYLEEWDLQDYAGMRISELDRKRFVILYVALAWVSHPAIVVVDDIESDLAKAQSERIMNLLLNLAHERNVTVLVGVLERDLAKMADGALYMGEE